jgi:signal transduction histidine kinase
MEYTLIRADGSEYLGELSIARLEDASGNPVGFIAVVRDISERKLMQEKILASERLATMGQLSGNISHELRNPLGVIASSAYYLKSALRGDDQKVEQHLERIKNNVDSAVAIIDSLLNLTRLKPPQLERLDLTAIISDAVISAKVPPTVSVVRDFPEQGLLVNADRVQLSMCFKNIVKNAADAMEGTGTLTVTVHETSDSQADISFADTGPGIPSDNLTKVFQPLFSTKAKGIGFGLSIAKMIVERHGGIIEAKSEPGKGANIIIHLPLEAKQHKEDNHA